MANKELELHFKMQRHQVAKALACSRSTVYRLEKDGRLHPEIGPRNVRYFDPEDVRRLQMQLRREGKITLDDGQTAAEVFERFEKKQPLPDIVRDLSVTPEEVHSLYKDWKDKNLANEEEPSEPSSDDPDFDMDREFKHREQIEFDRTVRELAKQSKPATWHPASSNREANQLNFGPEYSKPEARPAKKNVFLDGIKTELASMDPVQVAGIAIALMELPIVEQHFGKVLDALGKLIEPIGAQLFAAEEEKKSE